jgi:hypothetical protein
LRFEASNPWRLTKTTPVKRDHQETWLAQFHYVWGAARPSTGVTETLRAVWQKSIGLSKNSKEYKADIRAGRRKSINVAMHVAGVLGGEALSLA